ncbi:MAG: diguanylate cyclase [Gammaproteobacteria bacterium]|nr:diguanylate cyclase [Gammaproteobacteria bacterium]
MSFTEQDRQSQIPASAPVPVLLIEDDPGDAAVFISLLEQCPERFAVTIVERIAQALSKADGGYALVVTDLLLPDSTGIETVRKVLERFQDTPVVVLTGVTDTGLGLQAVQLGCQDYLVKGGRDPDALPRTLRYAIERKASQVALSGSEDRFRRLVELSPDAILLITETRINFANSAAKVMIASRDGQDLTGLEPSFLGHRDSRVTELIDAIFDGRQEAGHLTDCDLSTLTNHRLLADLSAVHIPYHEGPAIQLIIRDVSDRKRAERQQRLAAAVFNTTAEAMMVTDTSRCIIAINPAFTEVTGYSADEVLGRSSDLLASGRHDPPLWGQIQAALDRGGHWRGEVWNRRKDGTAYIQRQTISRVDDEQGGTRSYVSVFSDITAEKRAEEALIHVANHDALTGLPNRSLLEDRLEQALSQAARSRAHLAVMFFDLDGFKAVNDTHGHIAGDRLLQALAQRLLQCMRGSDTVARVGGDEFVVLGLDIEDRGNAAEVASKLLSTLREPFDLGNEITARIGASIGVALYPDDGIDALALLHCADQAMYLAKRRGKQQFAFLRDNGSTLI